MTQQSYRVAVFVETSRGYGRGLCEGIADFAQSNGNWMFKGGGESWKKDIAGIAGKVDGVIARIPDDEMAGALSKLGVPVVDLYRWREYPRIATVDADHGAIGRMAAAWFIERRFRHFAFCGYHSAPFSNLRGAAFKETAEQAGFACSIYEATRFKPDFLGKLILQAEAYGDPPDSRRLARWLKTLPLPTAILCCHDIRAYQVISVCKELGLDVPRDVAVMGVDNDRILCGFAYPMLTSVDPDAHQIGWTGAAMLHERLTRAGRAVRRALIAPSRIVERASTATDPVEPQWLADALRFIRKEIPAGVNAEEVIRHVGRSHTQVERAFVHAIGHTVHQEIARLRMREACRLLSETDYPASEVARLAGFSSPQYFNRLFCDEFGLPPAAYRHRHFR